MTSRKRSHAFNRDDEVASVEDSDDSQSVEAKAVASPASRATEGANIYDSGAAMATARRPSRLDRRRESNRLSKRRCRKQRKEMALTLEAEISGLNQEQKELKAENEKLRKELLECVLALQQQPPDTSEIAENPEPPSSTDASNRSDKLHSLPEAPARDDSLKRPASVPYSPQLNNAKASDFDSPAANLAGLVHIQEPHRTTAGYLTNPVEDFQRLLSAASNGPPNYVSGNSNLAALISLLNNRPPLVQGSASPLGGLPPAAAGPTSNPLIGVPENMFPLMAFGNQRHEPDMSRLVRLAASMNSSSSLGTGFSQGANSHASSPFPSNLQLGACLHLLQNSEEKRPATR